MECTPNPHYVAFLFCCLMLVRSEGNRQFYRHCCCGSSYHALIHDRSCNAYFVGCWSVVRKIANNFKGILSVYCTSPFQSTLSRRGPIVIVPTYRTIGVNSILQKNFLCSVQNHLKTRLYIVNGKRRCALLLTAGSLFPLKANTYT